MPAATTDKGRKGFILFLTVSPGLHQSVLQFLLCQAAVTGSDAAGAGAGAVPSGEETMLLPSAYQRYRWSRVLRNLPRHMLWLNWMIKERFGVPKGIHMQDLDQNPS